MSRKQTIYTAFFIILTLFIFSNSLQNADISSEHSGRIVNLVLKIFSSFNIDIPKDYLTHIIRKIAHITEFAFQSFALSGVMFNFKSKTKKHIILVLIVGLTTACIDEAIQLTSIGRSGQFKDIVIDFSGTFIGMYLYKIIHYKSL